MAEAIKVGLVGARFAARFHWEGLRRVYGVPVEVVGVTAKSAESREAFARAHGIKAFATFAELCDAVDVVDLCTPGSTHEPLAVAAFQRGKHVIIEKPFTGYYGPGTEDFRGNTFSKEVMLREALASCDRILDAARAAGKQLGYAENWVYAPAIAKEREIVAEKRRADSMDDWRLFAQRFPLPLLRHLEILRRRLAGGQGLPPAVGHSSPEARGGRGA